MDNKKTIEYFEKELSIFKAKFLDYLESPGCNDNQKDLEGLVVYLNAGHGNFKDGVNYTYPEHGKFYNFEDETGKLIYKAYEGETNRIFANLLRKELEKRGAFVLGVFHPDMDRENYQRIGIANTHFLQNKPKKSVWLSFHSNAVGNSSRGESLQARGTSFFYFPNSVISKGLAEMWNSEVSKITTVNHRGIFAANFEELRDTSMPAVLFENLFFTNLEDAKLLKDSIYQDAVIDATIEFLKKYLNS